MGKWRRAAFVVAVLTMGCVALAGEPESETTPNTSTFKVKVGVNYPGGATSTVTTPTEPELSYSDRIRNESFQPRFDLSQADIDRAERERQEKEKADQAERERREREAAERRRADAYRQETYRDPLRSYGDGSNALVTIDEFPTDIFSTKPAEPALPEKPEPKILATLYGEPITEDDVAREMWLRRGRETFDWLIGRDILKRELERLDLRVADSEIRDSLDKHIEVLRKAYPKLRKRDDLTRTASGMTLEEYRERTVWTELALRKIMQATLDTQDADLRRYFAAVKADYIKPERVMISQIFIPPQVDSDADGIADNEAWHRAEQQIGQAHAMLRHEDFADVARLYGSGAMAARWVKRGDLLRELEGPAFSIAVGSITTPIRSAMGWHMLRVEDREERREPMLEEVRGEVLARFEEERFVRLAGEFMARLKEKALGDGGLVMGDVPEVFAEAAQ